MTQEIYYTDKKVLSASKPAFFKHIVAKQYVYNVIILQNSFQSKT